MNETGTDPQDTAEPFDSERLGSQSTFEGNGSAEFQQPMGELTEKPEFYLGAAFLGGFLLARLLRRRGGGDGDE